jgi:hypothetical protein
VGIILDEGNKAGIGEALAVGQGEALDARADGERHDAAIVDLVGEGRQVETLDEVAVREVWSFEAQSLADGRMLLPVGASRAMPEDIDRVASPAFACEHAVKHI